MTTFFHIVIPNKIIIKNLLIFSISLTLFACGDTGSTSKFNYLEQYGQYAPRYNQESKEYEQVVDQIGLIMNDTLTQQKSNKIDSLLLSIQHLDQLEPLVLELAKVHQNDRSILFYLFHRTQQEVPNTNTNYWLRLQFRLSPKEHSYEASKIIFSKNFDFNTIDTLTTDRWRIGEEFHRWTYAELDTTGMSNGRKRLFIEMLNNDNFYSTAYRHEKGMNRFVMREMMRDIFDPERKYTMELHVDQD